MYLKTSFLGVCFVLLGISSAVGQPSPLDTPGFAPRLTIFLAKGPANACGSGCSHWIAVEGKIDAEAASRVRAFLRHVKDETLPFYFNSPGGDVRQGLAIGRMLRSRRATARVGRSHVTACGDDPQIGDDCEKLKTSEKELEADIVTNRAMCNSACSYLFLGATTREVAPDAAVGIHNTRIMLRFRGRPSPAMRAVAFEINRDRSNRDTASYVAAMGISDKLVNLIHETPFEKPHALTREELYHFGIDKREFAETNWTFDLAARPTVRKLIAIKSGDNSFRIEGWQFFCGGKDRVTLVILRETDLSVKDVHIGIENDQGEIIPVTSLPRRAGRYWGINAVIKSEDMSNLLDTGHLRVAEIAYSNDGPGRAGSFQIDMSTLDHVWTQFSLACAADRTITSPATNWPSIAVPPISTAPKTSP